MWMEIYTSVQHQIDMIEIKVFVIKLLLPQALEVGRLNTPSIEIRILGSHFEEMARCETKRLGAIPCLVYEMAFWIIGGWTLEVA